MSFWDIFIKNFQKVVIFLNVFTNSSFISVKFFALCKIFDNCWVISLKYRRLKFSISSFFLQFCLIYAVFHQFYQNFALYVFCEFVVIFCYFLPDLCYFLLDTIGHTAGGSILPLKNFAANKTRRQKHVQYVISNQTS